MSFLARVGEWLRAYGSIQAALLLSRGVYSKNLDRSAIAGCPPGPRRRSRLADDLSVSALGHKLNPSGRAFFNRRLRWGCLCPLDLVLRLGFEIAGVMA